MSKTLKRFRGDTKPEILTITDKTTGDPADLTACAFVMTFNTERDPADTTNQKGEITGAVHDLAAGEVAFPFDGIDILGPVFYDVQVTDAQGKTDTFMKGLAQFEQDISK